MDYLKAFIIGGILCVIGQILIDKTKLTPARILVSYVVIGVLLGAIGIYKPFAEFAGAGATVPLTGFGNTECLLPLLQVLSLHCTCCPWRIS